MAIADTAWREVGFMAGALHPGTPAGGREVRESVLSCADDVCSQSVAIPGEQAYFRILVAGSGAEAIASTIRQSLRVLPRGYTTVPFDSGSKFVGYTGTEAAKFMRANGLNVTTVEVASPDVASGALIGIDPQPGSVVHGDESVTLTVGAYVHVTSSPNVEGVDHLAGSWKPVTVDRKPVEHATAAAPTIRFSGDGTWAGSDGCNDLNGTYTVRPDGQFEAQLHASTLVGCVPMPTRTLPTQAVSISITGNTLTFLNGAGNELATYVRRN
ncbi:MAG: META domain-containing protein [Propionibacteriales bacterium]|nr:META domain-containing protein [Propionibacteriales bacterium]